MEHRDKVAWMVEQHGWAFEPVPAHPELDPPIPGYGYSIGFEAAFAFPELVVFGLTPVATRGLLGLVVDLLRGGTEIPIGALFTGLFAVADDWYEGEDYRLAQLAWPDRNGWLPWESGFDHRLLLAQPVVGGVEGLL